MRVIFLDVDGVLNTDGYLEAQTKRKNGIFSYTMIFNFDPQSMDNLKKIIEATNSKIVISSSWREGMRYNDLFWRTLINNLEKAGLGDRILGVTPISRKKSSRISKGNAIKEWLRQNRHLNIKKYIILDDEIESCEDICERLLLCDSYTGIDNYIREEAIKMLS